MSVNTQLEPKWISWELGMQRGHVTCDFFCVFWEALGAGLIWGQGAVRLHHTLAVHPFGLGQSFVNSQRLLVCVIRDVMMGATNRQRISLHAVLCCSEKCFPCTLDSFENGIKKLLFPF
jgi:hypothetical protein